MVLRLDPRLPVVWRSPWHVQIGIDPPRVILTDVTTAQERMLAALAVGVSEPGLAMIAGGSVPARDKLVAQLRPALVERAAAAPSTVAISGGERLVGVLSEALAGTGVHVVRAASVEDLADASPELAIIAGHYVLSPDVHAFWLRRDVPHLPVVLSDTGVQIGPVVEPGTGPCLLCLELHRRDADAAWPAIAAQLLGRPSAAETSVLLAETAATAARIVIERLASGPGEARSVNIDGDSGERYVRPWTVHPECGCTGLTGWEPVGRDRRGSGWASAARSGRAAD